MLLGCLLGYGSLDIGRASGDAPTGVLIERLLERLLRRDAMSLTECYDTGKDIVTVVPFPISLCTFRSPPILRANSRAW